MTAWLRPRDAGEAARLLSRPGYRAVAGATLVYAGDVKDVAGFVDVAELPDAAMVVPHASVWRIGPAIAWADLAEAELPADAAALHDAAAGLATWTCRNAGTLGGNLCAPPALADGLVALAVLDGSVSLHGPAGVRHRPFGNLLDGDLVDAATPLLAGIDLHGDTGRRSGFVRASACCGEWRNAAAVALSHGPGGVRVAVRRAGEPPVRRPDLEASLEGGGAPACVAAAVAADGAAVGRLLARLLERPGLWP